MSATSKVLSIVLKITDRATKPIRFILTKLKTVGKVIMTVQRSITSSAKGMFRALTSIKGLVIAFAALQIGRKVIGDMVMFEEKAAEVATLIGGMGKNEIQALSEDIRRAAVRGAQSFEDEYKAAYDAISAGVEARNLIGFLDTANTLATAGVTDAATSVDLLTTTLNAYNMETDRAGDLSDIFFVAVRKGKTTIEEQGRFLFQVAGQAKRANIAIEQVAAANAALTASGTPTRVSMTQTRAMIVELGRATTSLNREFKSVAGVGFRDFMKEGHDLGEVMVILRDLAKDTGRTVDDLFMSVEGGAAAGTLAGGGLDIFLETLDAMENRAGATQEAYETMAGTLAFTMRQMKAAASDLLATLFEPLRDPAKKVIAFVAEVTQAVREVFRAIKGGGKLRAQALDIMHDIFDSLTSLAQVAIKGLVTITAVTLIALVVPVAIITGRKAGAEGAKAMVVAYLDGVNALAGFIEQQTGLAMPGLGGMTAAIATVTNMKIDNLFGTGSLDMVKQINEHMAEVSGTLNDMAVVMKDDIGGAGNVVMDVLDRAIHMGNQLGPSVLEAFRNTNNEVDKLTEPSRWAKFLRGIKAGAKAFSDAIPTAAEFAKNAVMAVANSVSNNLATGFVDAVSGVKRWGDVMKQVLKDTLRMVSELIMRFLFMKAIGAAMGGGSSPVAASPIHGPPLPGPIPGGKTGGVFTGRAFEFGGGGIVPGPNVNRDIMPAMLAPGEGVLNRAAMASLGVARFKGLNRGDVKAIRQGGGVALNFHQTVYVQGSVDDKALNDIEDAAKRGYLDALRNDPDFRDQVRAYLAG